MIDTFFLKPVEVTVDGEAKVISTLEAIVMQLWLKEVSGDQRALKVRLRPDAVKPSSPGRLTA